MKRLAVMLLVVGTLILGLQGTSFAYLLTNGDFASGLTGWSASGDVDIANSPVYSGFSGNYAVLGRDTSSGNSLLSQWFTIPSDSETINVSFNYAFGGVDTSSWRDDDVNANLTQRLQWLIFTWNSENQFMQLESPDDYNLAGSYSGTIQVSDLLRNINPNAQIEFSLSEDSSSSTNSYFALDNIAVVPNSPASAVPEPATMVLLGSGLVGLLGLKRKK